jgi:putative heme-binding domain-containing protein
MAICDFYREIIEDYSAIPRHLQQQYGVITGMTAAASGSWKRRRSTRTQTSASPKRRCFSCERMMISRWMPRRAHSASKKSWSPTSHCSSHSASVPTKKALIALARNHGQLKWMDAAIASSAHHLEKDLLLSLATDPGKSEPVMHNLAGIIASRRDAQEISACLAVVTTGKAGDILRLGLEETKPLPQQAEVPAPTPPSAEQNAAWERRVPAVLAALKDKPNLDEGRVLFQSICGACHKSHGIGVSVGPDLDAEFQRAPEVILRDVLFPSEAARPGYETLHVKTQRGETLLGIAASDSPTSVTLKLPGGTERTVLRKRAEIRTLRNVSLMPAGLGDALKPEQSGQHHRVSALGTVKVVHLPSAQRNSPSITVSTATTSTSRRL